MLEQKVGISMREDVFSKYHPMINFIFFLTAILFGVLVQHPMYLLAGLFASMSYYVLLHGRSSWKTIGALVPLFFFLVMINPIFNTRGNTVLGYVFDRPYTKEALVYGVVIATIFVEMILWIGCYSKVLTSDKFICLFANVIPSLSLLLTMILRMIPNLLLKAKQIMGVRNTVGKGIQNGKEKLELGFLVLGVLTSWALEGGVMTSDSMCARGYGTGKRSSFQMYQIKTRDWCLLLIMLGLLAIILYFGAMGTMAAVFVPECNIVPVTGSTFLGFLAYIGYLMIPTTLQLKEILEWNILKYRI